MTVTLNLEPELEAGLVEKARAGGKTVEEYLLAMVEQVIAPVPADPRTPEERAAALERWAAGHRYTPPLSDYAVSRESIYEGPDFDERFG